jgi:hypothetical protein
MSQALRIQGAGMKTKLGLFALIVLTIGSPAQAQTPQDEKAVTPLQSNTRHAAA